MKKITARDTARISSLTTKLGDRTLRQILTPDGKRIMRPERVRNLVAGRGRMSEAEREALANATRNSQALAALKTRGAGKREFKVNRALRDWLTTGKSKGVDFKQSSEERERQLAAIKALRFLGVDPADGTFYVRKGGK